MAEATGTRRQTGGGAVAPKAPVARRVTRLRERALSDPAGARDDAWAWIAGLGRKADTDRAGALDELQQLFEAGQPATGIDGQTRRDPRHVDDAPACRQELAGAGTPAELNAETSSVHLAIRPHGSSTPVFSQTMTATVDSDGTLESVAVSGLAPGFYFARLAAHRHQRRYELVRDRLCGTAIRWRHLAPMGSVRRSELIT